MSWTIPILGLVAGIVLWPFFGYPVLLLVAARRERDEPAPPDDRDPLPSVSVVLPVRDEGPEIAERLEDLLAQEDVPDLEIVVVSDASLDGTEAAARRFSARGVRVLRVEGRRGKTACQQRGMREAHGEVVVLTDCGVRFAPGTLAALAARLRDPRVGCVGGRVVYETAGEGGSLARAWKRIWSFEDLLRRLESRAAGLTGVSGAVCGLRRATAPELDDHLLDDWSLAPATVASGRRCLYVPEATARKPASRDLIEDLRRRRRVAAQTLVTLWATRAWWANPRRPLYFLQVVSHKVLRYLTPPALLLAGCLLAGGWLAAPPATRWAWAIPSALVAGSLAAGFVGLATAGRGLTAPLWTMGYLWVLQGVLLAGWFDFLAGRRPAGWRPERGSPRAGPGEAIAGTERDEGAGP